MRTVILSLLLLSVIYSSVDGQGDKGTIKGVVKDQVSGQPMPGATIIVMETQQGTMAGIDGDYSISLDPGVYNIVCSFVAYDAITQKVSLIGGETINLDFTISESLVDIDEVVVTARANRESDNILLLERKEAVFSVESIGAMELSRKGASDVEEGVTKIVGITAMGPQQIFVRGLGDRYNNATLNKMPIPSGNPGRKVIDLSLIPSKVIQKVDVNKVFYSAEYADFCGATVDITTKEFLSESFLTVDVGAIYNTLSINNRMKFEDGFEGFKSMTGFNNSRYDLPSEIGPIDDPNNDFSSLVYDPFFTDFSYTTSTMLPAANIGLSAGKTFDLGGRTMSVLFAGGFRNDFDYSYGSKIFPEAGGAVIYDFDFEKWQYNANTSALASFNYRHNRNNSIDLDILFINNTDNSIEENMGYHSTNDGIIKARRYEYVNNRVIDGILGGEHTSFAGNDRLELHWKGSYSYSTNNTPDRRDLTWNYDEENDLYYLRRENIANYRTYMKMAEHEASGRLDFMVKLGQEGNDYNKGSIVSGLQFKLKTRDFIARDFFYETRYLPGVHDPENPSAYLSDEAFANGLLSLSEGTALSNYYLVFQYVYSGYIEMNYNITPDLLLSIGLRGEYDDQSLYYRKSPERTTFDDPWIILNTTAPGLYPSLNMRYSLKENTNLRLSASRTVSRPLFIELGPFVNRGMYGEHNTFGNPELTNSYNYNLDMKYEVFPNPGDLFSFALYGKYIVDPIEKYYKASSSRLVSWMNTKDAKIAGFEIEFRKKISNLMTSDNILSPLQLGFNFAYLYSLIDLGDEAGINTNAVRPLQGASPYLINADLTYPVMFKNGSVAFTLVYNTFGKRIYAVGTDGKDDIYELPVHTLDALVSVSLGNRISVKASFMNILNPAIIQNLTIGEEDMIVNEFHKGMTFGIGLSYNF